jgi:hypothetical protein
MVMEAVPAAVAPVPLVPAALVYVVVRAAVLVSVTPAADIAVIFPRLSSALS